MILSRRRCLWRSFQIRSESERQGYTDKRKDIAALSERMAKVEGLFEGFTKSSPQATPQ